MIRGLLKVNGTITLAEPMLSGSQRLSELVDTSSINPSLLELFQHAENSVYTDSENPSVNWTENSLKKIFVKAGFTSPQVNVKIYSLERRISSPDLNRWLKSGDPASGLSRGLREHMSEDNIAELEISLRRQLEGKTVPWRRAYVFVRAGMKETDIQ